MEIDTGQSDITNIISTQNNIDNKKEVEDLGENQKRNETMNKRQCKGILLEIEHKNAQLPEDEDEVDQIAIEHSIKIIEIG